MRLFLLVLSSLALVGACSSTPSRPPASSSLPEAQQATNAQVVSGYEVSIPKLNVKSNLVSLGLNPDKTIQVPALSRPRQLGLYSQGPKPGAQGPAAIFGHVNANHVPGAFAQLNTLKNGDLVNVSTPSGPQRFKVYRTATVNKDKFPTSQVYSNTEGPELRLITCGGDYDRAHRNYLSNVIVFAKLA